MARTVICPSHYFCQRQDLPDDLKFFRTRRFRRSFGLWLWFRFGFYFDNLWFGGDVVNLGGSACACHQRNCSCDSYYYGFVQVHWILHIGCYRFTSNEAGELPPSSEIGFPGGMVCVAEGVPLAERGVERWEVDDDEPLT